MNIALILAGGTGSRAGGPLPKQFQKIGGRRMLQWSIDAFRQFDPLCQIVIVIHPDYIHRWKELFPEEEYNETGKITKVPGGNTRIQSVRNGLEWLMSSSFPEDAKVYIHDGARPFVSTRIMERGAETVTTGIGAVPTVPLSDSIRKITPDGSQAVDRADYMAVQTPQIFLLKDIAGAYASVQDDKGLTDDASVAEKAGIRIRTYKGDPENFKITNPSDLKNVGARL